MSKIGIILPVLALFLALVSAQFKAPDCPDYLMSDFKYVKLVTRQSDTTLREPVRMAFDYRGEGKSDIYIAERHGKIKRWDALKNEISVIGELDVFSDDSAKPHKLPFAYEAETGINGIALDPDFKNNNRIWIFYSPWEDSVYRLSHFTVKDGKMEAEKKVMEMPVGLKHAGATVTIPGGPLHFDSKGDLWISVGANSEQYPSVDERIRKRSAEASSSNMADLRGSILRIRPDNSDKGYSIPKGNLGEYWSAEFEKHGKSALAKEYADPVKVRPEIYVKGTRNPYSMSVDSKTGALVWGEFGPNKMRVEELNMTNRPIYAGYPYWAGKNLFILDMIEPWASAGMDPKAPINKSVWNSGPRELPPAEPSTIAYSGYDNSGFMVGNNPISGPIYRYDGNMDSPVKFPPHFDGAWMTIDRWLGLRLLKVNEAGDGYVDSAIFKGAANEPATQWGRPLDLKAGPDGAIYVLDYVGYHRTEPLTHIGRYEYTGTCRPGVAVSRRSLLKTMPGVRVSTNSIVVERPGRHIVRVRTLEGSEVSRFTVNGPAEHSLNLPAGKGLYIITMDNGRGTWVVPRF